MSVDIKQLKELQKNINRLDTVLDNTMFEATEELAARTLRGCVKKTPVKSGHLKGSWRSSAVYKVGDGYTATIYNPVEYAMYVDMGHRTRNGRGWVEGRFMTLKTEREIEKIAPKLIQKRIDTRLKEVLDS